MAIFIINFELQIIYLILEHFSYTFSIYNKNKFSNKMKKTERSRIIIPQSYSEKALTYHSSCVRDKFIALCHSPEASEMAKFICGLFTQSMDYYLESILPKTKKSDSLGREFHQEKIANLLVSFR